MGDTRKEARHIPGARFDEKNETYNYTVPATPEDLARAVGVNRRPRVILFVASIALVSGLIGLILFRSFRRRRTAE